MTGERVDVVIVEDDPSLRAATAWILQDEGFTVCAIGRPEAALEAIVARRPLLVVTDELMPGMSGHELMRRAREQLGEGAPRFLLVTGASLPRALRMDFDGVLHKPFRLDDLLAHARRLGLRRSASGTRIRAAGEVHDTDTDAHG